jgi:hypothetical protein
MGPHLTQKPFGSLAIGPIGEETGFGYLVTGLGLQDPMQFGFQVIGRKEEGAGFGFLDIGNTTDQFGVKD